MRYEQCQADNYQSYKNIKSTDNGVKGSVPINPLLKAYL